MHFVFASSSTFVASLAVYLVVFLRLPFAVGAASSTAAAASSSVTAPPACFLGALQQLPNPADVKSICSSDQSAIQGNLTSVCSGDSLSSAVSVFSATCKAAGVSVTVTATATATSGSDSGSTTTGSGAANTASGTATGSGAAASGTSGAGLAAAPAQPFVLLSGLVGAVGVMLL